MFSSFDYFEKEIPIFTKLTKLTKTYCETDLNGDLFKIQKIRDTITVLIYEYDNSSVKKLTKRIILIVKECTDDFAAEQVLEYKPAKKVILTRTFSLAL